MAKYAAVSIFAIEDTLFRGSLMQRIVAAGLRSAPWHSGAALIDLFARAPYPGARSLFKSLSPRLREDLICRVAKDVAMNALRPGAIDTLIQRRRAGDRIIFVGDALDFCIAPLAACLGGADIAAAAGHAEAHGDLGFDRHVKPIRGFERLDLVRTVIGTAQRPPFIRAYASSETDFPLLEWADAGVLVNPKKALAQEAGARGLSVTDWNFGAHDAPMEKPQMVLPKVSQPKNKMGQGASQR